MRPREPKYSRPFHLITKQSANGCRQNISCSITETRIHENLVNPFEFLNNELECYICHNFGHKVVECRLRHYKPEPRISRNIEDLKVWKKKEDLKCDIVLSVQKQKDPWYNDSGCSKYMTGDKNKFLSLKEGKSGNVTFGIDALGKIRGKGMVSLSNGQGKAQDALLVEGLKHNLLSVS